MDRIQIEGNVPLCGKIKVQGAKNGALPIMAAAVLHRGMTVIKNCPRILDVEYMSEILRELGCLVWREDSALFINAENVDGGIVRSEYATKLRASVILTGSLLGRCGRAVLPYPGGCTIGMRPIDLHLKALTQMGAEVISAEDGLMLRTQKMRGSTIEFPFPSVGATENAILGAVLAEGITVLQGCAVEPEIEELCRFLCEKGACISGIGSTQLVISGVKKLKDSVHRLMSDRIVAGTYLLAAAGTRGSISLYDVCWEHLRYLLRTLSDAGAQISAEGSEIHMDAKQAVYPVKCLVTRPYPGFPTDLQSQMMVFLSRARGISRIEENMFESRFQIVEELKRMGADIEIEGNCAVIRGVSNLKGNFVRARELRGGAALVSAALMAEGRTILSGTEYIRRGYEDIVRDYTQLGADIKETG
ncbi:MAG: UDP-N-acetylglucosamine 1-carboxyvinyltransferase [Eubacteriales bacterium]|nr:UDP-N-acetylglucosamine 1-carboxyvinyltransferase [Eubacteriales bacterium]